MKGIIFREFLEMVETKFGYELVDEILINTPLETKGIYTSVGTYNHQELFVLGNAVSEKTGVAIQQLFFLFGNHVFTVFTQNFSHLISPHNDAFGFLSGIQDTIHVEVRKLYPEAELPVFKIERKSENELIMIYKSSRKMADFAEGLIYGCLDFYKIKAHIKKQALANDQTIVKFSIKKIEK